MNECYSLVQLGLHLMVSDQAFIYSGDTIMIFDQGHVTVWSWLANMGLYCVTPSVAT